MRVSTVALMALSWQFASGPSPLQAEDDILLRIESARESAEKARVETARKIQQDADRNAQELEERLAEVKKWTTAQFELAERGAIDKPKAMSRLLAQWQRKHELEIYRVLQFPERNKGMIESGRALNSLLERVGPAAAQNHRTRQLNPSDALPLHDSTAHEPISEDTYNRLTIQDRLLGAKDSRRGNEEPIDVNWPTVLREDRWEPHRNAVEVARRRVLEEMTTTQGLTPEADEQLRDAVGALNADFVAYRKEWCNQPHAPGTTSSEFRRIWLGSRHIRKLIESTYFVVDAKTFYELPQRQEYRGGNVEDFLAFMMRNNLQFGPPSKDVDRSAYHAVFNLMVRYYLDQSAMTELQQRLEQELDQQQETSREAMNVALGKTMSAADQAALCIEEMKFVRSLIDD